MKISTQFGVVEVVGDPNMQRHQIAFVQGERVQSVRVGSTDVCTRCFTRDGHLDDCDAKGRGAFLVATEQKLKAIGEGLRTYIEMLPECDAPMLPNNLEVHVLAGFGVVARLLGIAA